MRSALALLMILATLSGALTACAPTNDADSHSAKRGPYVDFSSGSGGGGGY